MDDIKRIGPPVPIAVRGPEYDLSVALNATPSPAWRRAFEAPDDWKEPHHPSRITVRNRALTFTSEEPLIPQWIEQIDKWIAAANQKLSDATAPEASAGVAGGDDRQRLQEAAERLKDL